MKRKARRVFPPDAEARQVNSSAEEIQAFFMRLASIDWLRETCASIEKGSRAALKQLSLPDYPELGGLPPERLGVGGRLAREALVMAHHLSQIQTPTRGHIHNAIMLGYAYGTLRAEVGPIPELVEIGRISKEEGAKGGRAKHVKEATKVRHRWDKLEARASLLNAAGRDRESILADLTNRAPGVKRSTIEKNPRVRKHLPRARRKPRP
jgi:hypothetical protein